jgi:hypothetical protein
MKRGWAWVLIGALGWVGGMGVHAEGNCPPGYYPIGGGNPGDPQGCAPIPGNGAGGAYPQQAPAPQWISEHGAIASDIDKGILGVATDARSTAQAEQAALDDCQAKGGTNCKPESSYANGCGAVVAGHPGYAVNSAPTQDQAIQAAMDACTGAGFTHCKLIYIGCSLPRQL